MPRAASNNWLVMNVAVLYRRADRSATLVGATPTLAGHPRQPAPAVSLWICGRRQEAPPTTPQERRKRKAAYRCTLEATRNSKEALFSIQTHCCTYQYRVVHRLSLWALSGFAQHLWGRGIQSS